MISFSLFESPFKRKHLIKQLPVTSDKVLHLAFSMNTSAYHQHLGGWLCIGVCVRECVCINTLVFCVFVCMCLFCVVRVCIEKKFNILKE